MQLSRLSDISVAGKRVFIRSDLNVPIHDGVITSEGRLHASLPTIQRCLREGAQVIVASHLGRPKAGQDDEAFSLKLVAKRLGELLGQPVKFVANWRDVREFENVPLAMLENVRFELGEKSDDVKLAKEYASLCDLFVMDAFATAHRAHASTHGIAFQAPDACAGLLVINEISALSQVIDNPKRPMVAIVGGTKVSTKIEVLDHLSSLADQIIVGGGMANIFLAAAKFSIGKSLYEEDQLRTVEEILNKTNIPLPVDVMVASSIGSDATAYLRLVGDVRCDEIIVDIGPETARQIAAVVKSASTVLWNGPMGIFEYDQFGEGTRVVGEAIGESDGYSLAGGGDTLAAIDKYNLADQIDYISTAGGAFLEFIENRPLPGIEALRR